MNKSAPLVACIGSDSARVRGWTDLVQRAGLRARGFTSPSGAISLAPAMRYDVVVTEPTVRGIDASFVAERLRAALGSIAPELIVVGTGEQHLDDADLVGAVRRACDARRAARS